MPTVNFLHANADGTYTGHMNIPEKPGYNATKRIFVANYLVRIIIILKFLPPR